MEFLNGHSGCVQCGSGHIVVCSVDMEVNYYYVSIILRSVEGSFEGSLEGNIFVTHFCFHHSFLPLSLISALMGTLATLPWGSFVGSVVWTVGRRVVRCGERPVQGRTVEQFKSLKHWTQEIKYVTSLSRQLRSWGGIGFWTLFLISKLCILQYSR